MRGKNYRIPRGQPLTRKEFMPGGPNVKVARFSTGNGGLDYDVRLQLIAKRRIQIRHNALEAARVAANKKMTPVGETAYFLAVKVYPHVILKENKMIATAGADRLQEGMRKSFGKPVSLGARVSDGTVLIELSVMKQNLNTAKEALSAAASKLPTPCRIVELHLEKRQPVPEAQAASPAAA